MLIPLLILTGFVVVLFFLLIFLNTCSRVAHLGDFVSGHSIKISNCQDELGFHDGRLSSLESDFSNLEREIKDHKVTPYAPDNVSLDLSEQQQLVNLAITAEEITNTLLIDHPDNDAPAEERFFFASRITSSLRRLEDAREQACPILNRFKCHEVPF